MDNIGSYLDGLLKSIIEYVPYIGAAFLVIIIGWLVATIVRWAVVRGLSLLKLKERMPSEFGSSNIERAIANTFFYVILFMSVIVALGQLKFGPLTDMVNRITAYAPNIIGAVILTIVALVLAKVVKYVMLKLVSFRLDNRLNLGDGMKDIGKNIANIFYWLVIILFIPLIVNALELGEMFAPVSDMINKVMAMLPNIFGAFVIGFIGFWVAKIAKNIVVSLLPSLGVDKIGQKIGLSSKTTISQLLGTVLYVVIIYIFATQALQALQIEAISGPVKSLFNEITNAIPPILTAAMILVVFYVIGRFIAPLIASLLEGVGFNNVPKLIGLDKAFSGTTTASQSAGKLIMFFIMLFAVVTAADKLNFPQITELVHSFIFFASKILLGAFILAVGFWLAGIVHKTILAAQGADGKMLAGLVRVLIIGLVLAMGLNSMGIAQNIVNMAFGATIGAVAVAFALSFGLGGREAAGKQMEAWFNKFKK